MNKNPKPQPPQPTRSLKQFEVLVGNWTMVGSHPQLPSTLHGHSSFEWLREGALLVNASRGGVVDTDALIAALGAGRIRAALDVTDPEPLPDGHPLWSLPGVLITPHVAGDVRREEERAWGLVADQVARLARGEPLRNVVVDGY